MDHQNHHHHLPHLLLDIMSKLAEKVEKQRTVVVITGCSSGLGRSMAIEFAAQPEYHVFATARNIETLRQLPAAIERVKLDVTDAESIKTAIDSITTSTFGCIDILINNAGLNTAVGPLVEVDIERIRKTFEPNVSRVTHLLRRQEQN